MWGMETNAYEKEYKKSPELAAGRLGDTARFPNYSTLQDSSNNSISQTSEESNPQNAGDLRQQLAQAEKEYMDASQRSDTEYDYAAQMAKIKELRSQIETEGENTASASTD